VSAARTPRNVARSIAKRASSLVTLPTARIRSLPDFLIIGAQRCGTTSLYRYLARHPAVESAVLNKGIHYFDTDFDRSLGWYRSHFPTDPYKTLLARRRGVRRVLTGEASPYYVFHPLAPARIADLLPTSKSILILRDPVSRAHSHYQHELARGFETLTFEEALEREDERLEGEEERMISDPSYYSFAHQHHSYVARGMYMDQIRRWLRFFPREQLMIVDAKDLFADPDATFRAVLRFLTLEEFSVDSYEKMNAHSYSGMSERARGFLETRFEEPNRALSEFLKRTSDGAGV
jgi:sulfotransferase family protein